MGKYSLLKTLIKYALFGGFIGLIFGLTWIFQGMSGWQGFLVDMVIEPCVFYTQCMNSKLDPAFDGYKCVGCIFTGPMIAIIHGCILGMMLWCIKSYFITKRAS